MMRQWMTGVAVMAAAWAAAGMAQAETPSLALKAEVFAHDLEERFLFDGQVMCKLRLPTADRPFVSFNKPDNAYMTGMYLGARAFEFAATDNNTARSHARDAVDALELLVTVSGQPGLLARAAIPIDMDWHDDGIWRESADGQYRWRGDVSSDQMTGVFFGLAYGYSYIAGGTEKRRIAAMAAALVDHLVENDWRIIGYDGEPTEWGRYDYEYVSRVEPMNALLLLQHLKVAAYVTEDPAYQALYERMAFEEGYAEIAIEARRMRPPLPVNHSDDVLLFLAYAPLLALMDSPEEVAAYTASLRRTWEGTETTPGVRVERNPFFELITRYYLSQYFPEDFAPLAAGDEAVLAPLREFPFRMKWNRDTVAAYAEHFGFDPAEPVISAAPADGEAVPFDRRAKSWSALVANPFEAGDNTPDAPTVYNGHDYLLSYWLARMLGVADETH